jgi:hypothetical protein
MKCRGFLVPVYVFGSLLLDHGLVPAGERLDTEKFGDRRGKVGEAVIMAVDHFVCILVDCIVVEDAGNLI